MTIEQRARFLANELAEKLALGASSIPFITDQFTPVIASAIRAAVEAERIECEKLAIAHARLFSGRPSTVASNACIRSAEDIADAIRARKVQP